MVCCVEFDVETSFWTQMVFSSCSPTLIGNTMRWCYSQFIKLCCAYKYDDVYARGSSPMIRRCRSPTYIMRKGGLELSHVMLLLCIISPPALATQHLCVTVPSSYVDPSVLLLLPASAASMIGVCVSANVRLIS